MKKQSKNNFYTKNKFWSYSSGKDERAGFLLLPSVWVKNNLQVSLEVMVKRIFFGFGYWRVRIDLGTFNRIDVDGPVSWDSIRSDSFFKWSKKFRDQNLTKKDLEAVFLKEPWIKKMVMYGTFDNHYVREIASKNIGTLIQAGILHDSPTPSLKKKATGLDPSSQLNFMAGNANGQISNEEQKSVDSLSQLGGRISSEN